MTVVREGSGFAGRRLGHLELTHTSTELRSGFDACGERRDNADVDRLHSRSFEPSAADVLRARYAGRLPDRLDELTGPLHGQVELPLHIAWSGLRVYDLDRPRQRMSLYRTVLAEGQRRDLLTYVNRHLLASQWPALRTLISRHIRDVWEDAFPDLAREASAAA
ncbi:hypothetical protein GCM10010280_09340 [Streptomyces pilosus]|uniref:Uncharacterized protein n=1 Tax=Streptomyces pilosus TaxID=28893 RepID=A0A918BFD1_9ACTN|nr:hypothetical protein GCM10010280_09340 [Streptomyces pilosus]